MNPQELYTLNTIKRARTEIKKKMFSYIAAGLGLVAGLAWNDAIKVLIDYFVPDIGNSVIVKILYATLLTSAVAIILYYGERSVDEDTA